MPDASAAPADLRPSFAERLECHCGIVVKIAASYCRLKRRIRDEIRPSPHRSTPMVPDELKTAWQALDRRLLVEIAEFERE